MGTRGASGDDVQLTPAWENELIEKGKSLDDQADKTVDAKTLGDEKETDAAGANDTEKQPSKGRVPTKTLAELHASQGDNQNAIQVYEELLAKHPTNKAYRKRLDDLKASL